MSSSAGNKLTEIRIAKQRLIICFWTLPIYVYLVTVIVSRNGDSFWLMMSYISIYAFFGIKAIVKSCPECKKQFFVRGLFLNIFVSKCVHCGLSYHPVE